MATYSRGNLPTSVDRMKLYRKTTVTPMVEVLGPLTVITQEGEYNLPDNWQGFLAVDDQGYPYPISRETHERTYEEVKAKD